MKLKRSEKITYIIGLHKAYYSFLTIAYDRMQQTGTADRCTGVVAAVNQVSLENFWERFLWESFFSNFWWLVAGNNG